MGTFPDVLAFPVGIEMSCLEIEFGSKVNAGDFRPGGS